MDVSANISTVATPSPTTFTRDVMAVKVMKKTMDIQAATAQQLIQALPPAPQALPDNLGKNLNVTA